VILRRWIRALFGLAVDPGDARVSRDVVRAQLRYDARPAPRRRRAVGDVARCAMTTHQEPPALPGEVWRGQIGSRWCALTETGEAYRWRDDRPGADFWIHASFQDADRIVAAALGAERARAERAESRIAQAREHLSTLDPDESPALRMALRALGVEM